MIVKSPRSNAQDSKQRPRFQIDVLKELRESHRSVEETEMCLKAIDLIWKYIDGIEGNESLFGVWFVMMKVAACKDAREKKEIGGLSILMQAQKAIREANPDKVNFL